MTESDTMFNERDQRCAAVQLMHSSDPSYNKRTIASTLKNTNPGGSTLKATAQCIGRPFGGGGAEGHFMLPHIFEVGLKVNTKVYLDVLKSVVIPWCNHVAGGRPWLGAAGLGAGPQVQRDPGLASEGVLRQCTLLSLAPSSPDLISLDYYRLVIRREHLQHDFPQHRSQPYSHHPLSIRRAPAGACGKGMRPVPDPYQGGD